MKYLARILLVVSIFFFAISGCEKDNDFNDVVCGEFNNNQLLKEPDGGCYYIDSVGHKIYVDDSECDC